MKLVPHKKNLLIRLKDMQDLEAQASTYELKYWNIQSVYKFTISNELWIKFGARWPILDYIILSTVATIPQK